MLSLRARHAVGIPKVQRMADVFAVSCSGLCAVHCLATPILLIFLPVLSASVFNDESFHAAILWFILPTSLLALLLGCSRHKDRRVILLCAFGLAVILLAVRFGDAFFGEFGERIITTAGSVLLIAGHIRNFSLCRNAACRA